MDDEAVERDLIVTFVDFLWVTCLHAIIQDDDFELRHYLPQWLPILESGADAWRRAIEADNAPQFDELD